MLNFQNNWKSLRIINKQLIHYKTTSLDILLFLKIKKIKEKKILFLISKIIKNQKKNYELKIRKINIS